MLKVSSRRSICLARIVFKMRSSSGERPSGSNSLLFDLRFTLDGGECGRAFNIVGEHGNFNFLSELLHVFPGHGVRMR